MPRVRIRTTSGARPGPRRQPGARYPGGRLKHEKVDPNERIVAARAAMGLTEDGHRMGPIRYAYSKGWLSAEEMITAEVYRNAYARSGLSKSVVDDDTDATVVNDLKFDWSSLSPDERMDLDWAALKGHMSKIWDNVWGSGANTPSAAERKSTLQIWKAMGLATTLAERCEVDLVVLQGNWPLWVIQRNAGHMTSGWEVKRMLLQSGLAKMSRALRTLKAANDDYATSRKTG